MENKINNIETSVEHMKTTVQVIHKDMVSVVDSIKEIHSTMKDLVVSNHSRDEAMKEFMETTDSRFEMIRKRLDVVDRKVTKKRTAKREIINNVLGLLVIVAVSFFFWVVVIK